MGFKLSVTNLQVKVTHILDKGYNWSLGVGIHICYGDRKWDNHSVFVFTVLRRSDFNYSSNYS